MTGFMKTAFIPFSPTPSGAMPQWLMQQYDEVRQVGPDGVRNLPGRRHNFCPTSPLMRRKVKKLDRELSRRLGNHPGVILWHISNEYGGNRLGGECHCELCQEAFREWLQKKYKTLENLNHAGGLPSGATPLPPGIRSTARFRTGKSGFTA